MKPTKEELTTFLRKEFPQSKAIILNVGEMSATIKYPVGIDQLRPGRKVSGPILMTLADVAFYLAVLDEIGIVPLAVTTNLSINFLRKPGADKDIIGVCKLLKLGKTLAVGEVSIYSKSSDDLVAHAVGTYAIPRKE
jgi:uncharacterized protein (TIGR00369 family)